MTKSFKKVGFLGGSFDPLHFGHIHLGIEMLERWKLDEVIVCPANFSPTKEDKKPKASKKQRKEMLELGIGSIKGFSLLFSELEQDVPSYTIYTIMALLNQAKERGDQVQYYLLLGEDTLSSLVKWKRIEELIQLASPLIGTRPSFQEERELPSFLLEAVRKGFTSIPSMEISSSEIRDRIKNEKYCGHLVPAKVLDYIYLNQLYLF